jgi:hypothetical protein
MTQIDGRTVGDAEHMPAGRFSIQWKMNRFFYAFVVAAVLTRGIDPSDTHGYFGSFLVIGAAVFGILTAYAYWFRRRWARKYAED